MEQIFNNNSLDLKTLREFCEQNSKGIVYFKDDLLEHESASARWLVFVIEDVSNM